MFESQPGASEVAMIRVTELKQFGPAAMSVKHQIDELLGSAFKAQHVNRGGPRLQTAVFPYAGDRNELADKIDFGKVTGIDASERLIIVSADVAKLPEALPDLTKPAARNNPQVFGKFLDALRREGADGQVPRSPRHMTEVLQHIRMYLRPSQQREEFRAQFIRFLEHPVSGVRREALECLAIWGEPEDVPAIEALYVDKSFDGFSDVVQQRARHAAEAITRRNRR